MVEEKCTIVYSSGKKSRTEVSREVVPLKGRIPKDLVAFMRKMMTFLATEVCEETRKANITDQLNECACGALKVSLSKPIHALLEFPCPYQFFF